MTVSLIVTSAAEGREDPNILPRPEDIILAYLYLMGVRRKNVTSQAMNAQTTLE